MIVGGKNKQKEQKERLCFVIKKTAVQQIITFCNTKHKLHHPTSIIQPLNYNPIQLQNQTTPNKTMAKSAAQIRRMQKRAEKRGETYQAPPTTISKYDERKANIAKVLLETLSKLEKNEEGLNSKEKRASKRKAEAIALEEVNAIVVEKDDKDENDAAMDDNVDGNAKEEGAEKVTNAEELLTWFQANKKRLSKFSKTKTNQSTTATSSKPIMSEEEQSKLTAYQTYQKALSDIESNKEYNSKDRRSAKRKADAIACEESKCSSTEELCDWYKSNPQFHFNPKNKKKTKGSDDDNDEGEGMNKRKNPYILFIGQIPYNTTKEDLYKHFQKYIGKKEIHKESMVIRIPHDEKRTKKMQEKQIQQQENYDELGAEEVPDYDDELQYNTNNNDPTKPPQSMCRGFAFAEFNDPELMYECLKLHHTDLNGRRINVIRGTGGGKEARKEKHKQRRKEQDEYISSTVDKIIQDYINKGLLQEGELDDGAVLLCKRRSAAIVELALSEYIEQRGDKDLENPSSFFSRVICDVTEEGQAGTQAFVKKRKVGEGRGGRRDNSKQGNKRRRSDNGGDGTKFESSSILAKSGVDMSISQNEDLDGQETNSMSKIFPSMRGRGRGRGAYM